MGEWRKGLAVGLTHGVIDVIKQNGKCLATQVWYLEREMRLSVRKRGFPVVFIIYLFHIPVSACVWVVSGHRKKRRRCPDQERGRKQTSGLSTGPPLWECATDLRGGGGEKKSWIWNLKDKKKRLQMSENHSSLDSSYDISMFLSNLNFMYL